MRKDIFIDNNIAKNFSNPLDPEYKSLVNWLQTNHKDEEQKAYLVVSQKLITEYSRSSSHAHSATNMPTIINILLREGRLVKISNDKIRDFQHQYFTKAVKRRLRSNAEDKEHIPVVLLSERKYALTIDKNLTHDLLDFPKFRATVKARPEELPYDT
jgi:hypothetical protein